MGRPAGTRKTGGRKKGTKNKRSIAQGRSLEQELSQYEGPRPLPAMLDNVRFAVEMAGEAQKRFDKATGEAAQVLLDLVWRYRSIAQDWSKDAAVYVHPRMQQVEHNGPGRGAIVHKIEVEFVRPAPQAAD